jgi:serine/threonine protein kinase
VTVETGTRIGRYTLGRRLGAGGMGEVFQAHDTVLGREVAVKVVLSMWAANIDQLRRFEQEARAAAALNHPGVLSVYDVGVQDNHPYLVTELLDGVTLRERLSTGPLPPEIAIRYGVDVLHALAAAHEKGIVHRDIKPENLFVTSKDTIKILDFGLAKLTLPLDTSASLMDMTNAGTLPQAVLGTLGYMAPEQARAQSVDHRADIFSFGCVLFEMLEGRRPFGGSTAADMMSAILRDPTPRLADSAERPVNSALEQTVQRCLEKNPAARFQSASDLAFTLSNLASERGYAATQETQRLEIPPSPRKKSWQPRAAVVGALTLVAAVAAGFGISRLTARTPTPDVVEFVVPPPAGDQSFAPMPLPGLNPTAPEGSVSPDGRTLAFVGAGPSGLRRLWVRTLDTSAAHAIAGTDDVNSWPFWSPDSRSLVFGANRILWKLDLGSERMERLCALPAEAPAIPFITGAWRDDVVVFSVGAAGLFRVAATGGRPEPLTKIDTGRGDNYHSWPQVLPGGHVMFFIRTNDMQTTGVYASRLDGSEIKAILPSTSRAVYASGYLLWTTEDRLVAQTFDAGTLRLSGQPVTVVPSVYQGAGRTAAFWASETGTLLYATGGSPQRQFRWIGRAGNVLEDIGPADFYASFDLSADAKQVVAEVRREPRSTLVMLDTVRKVLTTLTVGELNDTDPRFGPGGDVAFARNSGDIPGVFRVHAGGGSPSVLMPRGKLPVLWLEDWSAANGSVVYHSAADRDAWLLLSSDAPPRRLTQARRESVEQVQLSPDQRWIAYNNADSGRSEVYVSPVSADGRRWQVSDAGGVQGIWRNDGRELYYLGLDGGLYAVDIAGSADTIEASRPRLLFRTELPVISAVVEQYRATGDGQKFLFCLPLTSVQRDPLRVVLNWPARLAQSH